MTVLRRIGPIGILIAGGCLSLTLLALKGPIRLAGVSPDQAPAPSRWDRWHTTTPTRRASIAAEFQRVTRRADARAVLNNAAEFAALTPAEQDRLRDLNTLIEEALRDQQPVRRRWLGGLPADARALELYRLLKEGYADRLRRF